MQAWRYAGKLSHDQHPRWIVVCNFEEFHIHDMNHPYSTPEIVKLANLENEYQRLNFLVDIGDENIKHEMDISIKAGELVGRIYDALKKRYINPDDERALKSLNMLCVRLVFCLYAEDAGIFGKHNMFHDYIQDCGVKRARQGIIDLFKVLDTKYEERDPYMDEDLAAFPYVNGGLFADEDIEIPQFNQEIFELLLSRASEDFNWSEISPTIFGAVFESTLNQDTRRKGGMHYTAIEDIHKVIDPLFLDELHAEFESIKNIKVISLREKRLLEFQEKLASLKFFDPACGSGNFLTETYLSLRKLENEAISIIYSGKIVMGDVLKPIKVSINQFYGIEINDFATNVAKTALWIAESQMLKKTEEILYMQLDFLPLKSYENNIIGGNALRIDWETIIPKSQVSYIFGNPPFVGSSIKSVAEQQKRDKEIVFGNAKAAGKLDYVACWYKKAFDYVGNEDIEIAFVSTNSITQGEQVRPLWEPLLSKGLFINFAYRTFRWNNNANIVAHVHCVIICVSKKERKEKFIITEGIRKSAKHINGYLIDAPDFYINSRSTPPKGMPKLTQGNKPWDDGGLVVSPEERKELIKKYPHLEPYIKPYLGSKEFIGAKERYCFWFVGASPMVYSKIPELIKRFQIVANIRRNSTTLAVQKQALTPMLFSQIRQPKSDFILIPETSSQSRRYVPMGFMDKNTIISNSTMAMEHATLYIFGILESNVHMAWMRALCGRMKSDYRYSPAIYDNFPWPTPTDVQKARIEQTAQAILDARAYHSDCSLAILYDEHTMPPELRKAHQRNDRAVMEAYGFWGKLNTEADCVAELIKMHQSLVQK